MKYIYIMIISIEYPLIKLLALISRKSLGIKAWSAAGVDQATTFSQLINARVQVLFGHCLVFTDAPC